MIRIAFLMLVLVGFALGACGTAQKQAALPGGPLLPLPDEFAVREPGNAALMSTLESYVRAKGGPDNSQFEYTRIDLDGDGRREAIAIMKSPHQYWCNADGCAMAIFRANDDNFTLASEVTPVRGPLIVSESRSNGWRDLIVRVSGRTGWNAKDIALRFDGRRYPPQPAFEPALEIASNAVSGVRIFP